MHKMVFAEETKGQHGQTVDVVFACERCKRKIGVPVDLAQKRDDGSWQPPSGVEAGHSLGKVCDLGKVTPGT